MPLKRPYLRRMPYFEEPTVTLHDEDNLDDVQREINDAKEEGDFEKIQMLRAKERLLLIQEIEKYKNKSSALAMQDDDLSIMKMTSIDIASTD